MGVLQGQRAPFPHLGEHREQTQTWRPRAVHGEKVGTEPRVLAQGMQRPRASLSPLTAWVENATAALVLCITVSAADSDDAQAHLGVPRLKVAAAWPGWITEL